MNFAQDFMKFNQNLQNINTSRGLYGDGYSDTTFKISRLKSDWSTYFTNMKSIVISDDHWNREDLSHFLHLNQFIIAAASLHHSLSPTGNPLVPIPVTVIDNIIKQIAAGAGVTILNGYINIMSGGTARSTASDAALATLKSKGWTVIVNNVTL